ncbi:hypothetical protein IDAT_08635 [Pseudidiomarina atlantica]|uniref:diguanylate cyclase n=1 Tax=Pseudidiomarina atlantica TaxID=1517416 RepID=A0A094IRC9_9GAMM|nr:diguanylate cyclase [Pseudidiomarina atlantica]KFZ28369.1 hypothetical protein IDAT_08635 [Pseudidiomarina atlantica]
MNESYDSNPYDSRLTNFAWGVGFGSVAALCNYFLAFELYGSVTILMGQLFVMLALFSRGLFTALISVLIASSAIYLYTDNIFFLVTMTAEVIAIYLLYKRNVPILLADLIYWVAFGGPLTYLYLPTIIDVPQDFLILILAKLLLNGLLYTALAILLYQLIPRTWRVSVMKQVSDTLSGRIFYLSFLCIIVSSLCFSMLYTLRSAQQTERQIVTDIGSKANNLRQVTEDFVHGHVIAVRNLRDSMLRVDSYAERIALLEQAQLSFPAFTTMLITDAEGRILHGVPTSQFTAILSRNQSIPNVDDRSYFQVPKNTSEGYVSSAFRGRGFGTMPIIAISEPLIVDGEFMGIVEGSLNIPELHNLVRRTGINPSFENVVVTDNDDQIIFASDNLNLPSLATFVPTNRTNLYTQNLPLMQLNERDALYTQRLNTFGWNIYVFSDPQQLTELFLENLIDLFIFLLLITGLFAFVTRRFAQDINRPLIHLAEHLRNNTELPLVIERNDMTREVTTIAENLIAARKIMLNFNKQLQHQVEEKTADLEKLNAKLQKLAREDGLTELLNRRTFDDLAEQRYHEAMATRRPIALMLMDIDYFKRINDTMGHPIGDECIRAVGQLLREHFERRGDLVGRYGGEEFAVFMSDCADVRKVVEGFQHDLATHCQVNGQVIPMTMSMGIVEIRREYSGSSFRRLVAQADKLLYQSKDDGRSRISMTTL